MPSGQNEAFSRVLIDKALEFSGWNLLDPQQVRFELNTATGRADYLLGGHRGPLSVLEGKRENLDPYDAKEQARGYAENVKAPFIILSNGKIHYFWNYTRPDQDAYRIERLPSQEDLERLWLPRRLEWNSAGGALMLYQACDFMNTIFPLVAPDDKIAEARNVYGRTIQDILAKEPERDLYMILGAIEVLVGSKLSQKLATSPAERMVFALTWLAREVGSGGFRQFFINSAGDFWRDVLEGLIVIGDQQGLAMFRQTLSIFPNAAPSEDRQTRLKQLNALEEKDEVRLSEHLNELTTRYFRTPFPKWELVFDYVKAHPDEFDLRNA